MSYAFATQTAAVATSKGIPVAITKGEVWNASDPIVKSYPEFFSDAPAKLRGTVPEAAKKTAASK